MIDILNLAEVRTFFSLSGIFIWLVIALVVIGIPILIIISLIRVGKYLTARKQEQKLFRIEVGKLAEEVHQLRQDLKAKTE